MGVRQLDKIRVYELSKELNTTSKRLMEKLKEINIEVKNHMSLLNEGELKALYSHIGIVKSDSVNHSEAGNSRDTKDIKVEKPVEKTSVPSNKQKKELKGTPRIIRKTEVIIGDEKNEETNANKKKSSTNKQKGNRKNLVKRTDENSGLRMGFIRDKGMDYLKPSKPTEEVKMVPEKEVIKTEEVKEVKVSKEADKIVNKVEQKDAKSEVVPKIEKEATENKAKKVEHTDKRPKGKFDDRNKDRVRTDNRSTYNKTTTDSDNKTGVNKTFNRQPNDTRPRTSDNRNDLSRNKDGNKTYSNNQSGTGNRTYSNNQGAGNKTYSNNQGTGNRTYSNNQGTGNKTYSNNQGGTGNRTYSNNQGTGNRPVGTKTFGNKPAGTGNKPFGNRPAGSGNKSFGNKPPVKKSLEIPPPADLSVIKKEEVSQQRSEARREFQNKVGAKDFSKDQRRETGAKPVVNGKDSRFNVQKKLILGEKKGVSEVLSDNYVLDELLEGASDKKVKKSRNRKGYYDSRSRVKEVPKREAIIEVLKLITVPESITVKELAERLKKTSAEIIKKLMALGIMATLNQELDHETAVIVATEYGVEVKKEIVISEEDILFDDSEDTETELEERPPVVVVMGHVDHGKTSLLDAIRETNVIEKEAGGITQHIGAYTVEVNDRIITFLDTPGHEAFTAMRARGAQVTDIAILVVAADDGIMPQTVEAINHAKAANVTVIVAINKIDKEGANPDRVKQDLTGYGLVPEEWGGDIICVPVSAKKRINIDQLLEMVLLSADVLELKASKNKQAKGTVIEARLDQTRGVLATLLVQRGTLKLGGTIVAGSTVGRIRAMVNDKGIRTDEAGPSTPVEVLGLPEVPEAGEVFYSVEDEKVARQLVEKRKQKTREQNINSSSRVSLDDLFNQIKEGKVKDLNIIIKADVQGSAEAVKQSLVKLSNDEVRVKIVHDGVGAITESDVTLAEVSNAIIIGFNVRPASNITDMAKKAGVDIKLYRVIYNAIEDIQSAMKGLLEPSYKEVVQGHAEIRQIFKVSGIGTIGGSYVTDGKIVRNSEVRIVRDGIVAHEGKLSSLKRFKDDAKEVASGYECGLSIEKYNDIREGDVVESFVMEEVKHV